MQRMSHTTYDRKVSNKSYLVCPLYTHVLQSLMYDKKELDEVYSREECGFG